MRGRQSRMPSASMRISSMWADGAHQTVLKSRRIPLVMARAMMSAATPAATPAMEMVVTTPTTAWRRLALRYRKARNNSNRMGLTTPYIPPRNWMMWRRSRFVGRWTGMGAYSRMALRSSAALARAALLASVSR